MLCAPQTGPGWRSGREAAQQRLGSLEVRGHGAPGPLGLTREDRVRDGRVSACRASGPPGWFVAAAGEGQSSGKVGGDWLMPVCPQRAVRQGACERQVNRHDP